MRTIALISMGVFMVHLALSDTDDGRSVALLAIISHAMVLIYATHFIYKQSNEESVHNNDGGAGNIPANDGIKADN